MYDLLTISYFYISTLIIVIIKLKRYIIRFYYRKSIVMMSNILEYESI